MIPMMSGEIIVRACKYDGRVHREWKARLIRQEDSLLVLDARFAEEIRHPLLGLIEKGTRSIEYYWTDRWYNIFRFENASGELRNYYCNINIPAELDDDTLSFVDLDVDVLVRPDFTCEILDEEEFETNSLLYNYPPEMRRKAQEALRALLELIANRRFPFDAAETL
jgi:protein associated with RNAse G/E